MKRLFAVALVVVAGAADAAGQWKQPKTPWGDPDLQGLWPLAHLISVPLERPEKYGNRLTFTDEEMAALDRARAFASTAPID